MLVSRDPLSAPQVWSMLLGSLGERGRPGERGTTIHGLLLGGIALVGVLRARRSVGSASCSRPFLFLVAFMYLGRYRRHCRDLVDQRRSAASLSPSSSCKIAYVSLPRGVAAVRSGHAGLILTALGVH